MYKIIGADGQQYGPVPPDQVRRWLAENRVNAQTQAQAEGSTEWKPLGTFAEFAPGPGSVPPTMKPPSPVPGDIASRASSKIPAGVCGILLGTFGIHKFILGYTGSGLILLLVSVLTCGILAPLSHVIGLIEGIIYLCKSDEDFVRTYVDNRREWF